MTDNDPRRAPEESGDRPGRVSVGDAIVLGLSGSGPAQTLAVSLAALVSACAYGGIVPLLLCFVPMLGIAIGYQRLNRWDANSGATFAWVARVFHPFLGFLCGWMILLYYTLGTSSLTIPAGTYTLALLAPSHVNDHVAVAITGGAWNVFVAALALKGIRAAARFAWLIVGFQYVVLFTAAVAGIATLLEGHAATHFSWHWFSLQGMGGWRGLMSGILIACFMYSGWDAAVYVNEESRERIESPGRAAIVSVVILALLYVLAVLGFQAVLSPAQLEGHAGDALAVIGAQLLPGPGSTIMSLVVLTGALATLEAAVISAARVGSAMSRERVMPAVLRRVDPRTGNPWAATLVMGLVNLVLLALTLATSSIARALGNVVSSLGLIAVLFYGLTAAAAVWQGRGTLARSAADLIAGGVLPGFGVLFMAWVLAESVRSGAASTIVVVYGMGSVALGAVIAFVIHRMGRVEFFRRGAEVTATALHNSRDARREHELS